jgi:hypothetical protein
MTVCAATDFKKRALAVRLPAPIIFAEYALIA